MTVAQQTLQAAIAQQAALDLPARYSNTTVHAVPAHKDEAQEALAFQRDVSSLDALLRVDDDLREIDFSMIHPAHGISIAV